MKIDKYDFNKSLEFLLDEMPDFKNEPLGLIGLRDLLKEYKRRNALYFEAHLARERQQIFTQDKVIEVLAREIERLDLTNKTLTA